MPRDLLPIARFPLPEDWEPEGTICAVFVIPNDPEYLATITGLVDELKWSRNFARDETGTGAATVARTWKAALESQPVNTQECDMPTFRVNSDCLLEFNCGTDEEPNWQPVFTTEHPGGEAEIPYPEGTPEYEDDTARCIAAANITAQLKYGTSTLVGDADIVSGIAIAIIGILGVFLVLVPGGVLVDIALAIITFAIGHTAEEFEDDLPDIDWESVRDNLACMIERNGSVTESDKAVFLDWMDTQYVGNLAWGLSKIIIQHVSADGLTNDARMHQEDIDTEGCESCTGWHKVWDFSIDAQGWSPYTGDTSYIAGVGWTATGRDLQILIAGPTRTVTRQKIVFGVPSESTTRVVFLNYDTSLGYDQSGVGGVLEWTSGDLGNMTFYDGLFTGGALAVGHSWVGYTVVQVEEWGEGVMPW